MQPILEYLKMGNCLSYGDVKWYSLIKKYAIESYSIWNQIDQVRPFFQVFPAAIVESLENV